MTSKAGESSLAVRHVVADKIPGNSTVKDVFLAVLQLVGYVFAVKKSQIQPSGGIRHLDPGDVQTLADVGGLGGVHDHSPEAGGNIRLQFLNGHQSGPVLIAPGEMTDQIPKGKDIQICKLLCLAGADAFEHGNGVC